MITGSIKKGVHRTDFAQIPNEMLQKPALSMKAKGMLCYLLSLPSDWVVYKKKLQENFTDGRDACSSAFQELIEHKYIIAERVRGEGGVFEGYNYEVYDNPRSEQIEPQTDYPETVSPYTENPKLTNKEDTNTHGITKKNKQKKTSSSAIPPFEEFLEHALSKKPNVDPEETKKKYEAWVYNDWHNGNGKKIKNWRGALNNTLPHIREAKNGYTHPSVNPDKGKWKVRWKGMAWQTVEKDRKELFERNYNQPGMNFEAILIE